jgi:hypothetical protein
MGLNGIVIDMILVIINNGEYSQTKKSAQTDYSYFKANKDKE